MTDEAKPAKSRACPICGKPVDARYKPFCSRRCADVDLNRWLKGGYSIPAAPDDEADGAPAPHDPGHDAE